MLWSGLAGVDLRILDRHLSIAVPDARLRLSHRRLGEADRNAIVGWVDDHQQIALVNELIVGNRQIDDAARDLGRNRRVHGAPM